ncbi:MAG: beta-N-acetylhexosaminidase [Erythrobacter sp.]
MTPAIFGIAGESLSAEERAFYKECDPAGYILFARNCVTPDQLRGLTDDLRDIHGRDDTLISIDQEGGRVVRMKPPEWASYPSGEVFDRLYQTAPATAIEAARINSRAMGAELASMGVNVTFQAPLDVRREETDNVIGDRSLGSDPVQVVALGRAVIEGLAEAGVTGCLKHMPGHGRAMADSHKELPIVTASADELEVDIAPFRALASKAKIGMSAHIEFTAWDADLPATLSPAVIDNIIRGAIGFDGLLLTDDIDMQALNGTIADRSAKALAAGCDVVLNCWAKIPDMEATVEAVPALTKRGEERLAEAFPAKPAAIEESERKDLLAKRDALLAVANA